MKLIKTADSDFNAKFESLIKRARADGEDIEPKVAAILREVREGGDRAVLDQVARFDGWSPRSIEDIIVKEDEIEAAWEATDENLKNALKTAGDRIRSFHEKQKPLSWIDFGEGGWLGQKIAPMERAGIYVPGGKAAYPSTFLMNAIPAIVAGVDEIEACTPAPANRLNPLVLAAARLCGVKRIFKIGGAAAIGAMAYGTESIPKADIVTGPGNIFVATAKRMVFGAAQIDMVAGPSEVCVIADSSADAERIAIDLISQAEHDEMAAAILITPDQELAESVVKEAAAILETIERKAIAKASIETRGAVIVAADIDEAVAIANRIAPEHLEILTANPHALLGKIRHAGAIFLGTYSPEAAGDYAAGPNHTLPTGGTARFFSPLGVENFLKKSSVISLSESGFNSIAAACRDLALAEGLGAHALSVVKRMKP